MLNARNLERRVSLRGQGVFKYTHVKFSADDKVGRGAGERGKGTVSGCKEA